MTLPQLLSKFFEIRDQAHYWHLQDKGPGSYAEHKALNTFYEEWIDLVDEFVETYQGRYPYAEGDISFILKTYPVGQPDAVKSWFGGVILFLQGDARKLIYPIDSDLNNILDEMQALASRTIYMLNMR